MSEKDWKKEAGYLRDELDRREDEARREQERAYEERQEQRRQRERDWQEEQCYADSWEEAFRKAIPRLQKEASAEAALKGEIPDFDDDFFLHEVEQHRFAQQVWQEEQKRVREQIAEIEKQARERTAARVEEKYPGANVAENLRNDDYNALVNW